MKEQSVINAFRGTLSHWRFKPSDDFSESFAIRRYLKKFEVPDQANSMERKQKCFDSYIEFDRGLREPDGFLPARWYRARQRVHKALKRFRLAPVGFTNGSEVTSTGGLNSIESKLIRSKWECTPDCFMLWAKTAYECAAIKRATRKRLATKLGNDREKIRQFHVESWKRYKGRRNRRFLCFSRALASVTIVYEASRFSTVPKNNEVDRPIALEGVPVMCVQRRIGNGIRLILKDEFGVDLDSLAVKHREIIKDKSLATIDLSNASDGIAMWLVEFLCPKWFVRLVSQARTPYLEGLDGNFYVLNKVSSMGCGFTFELMSFILLCIGLESSPLFSVFGDDIIVPNEAAFKVISDLKAVGLVVNEEKSFVDSRFRESCGANWHDDHGYIRSFDFRWPKTIIDCVVICNKAYLLGRCYKQFYELWKDLSRLVPSAWQGPVDEATASSSERHTLDKDFDLAPYFWHPMPGVGCHFKDHHVRRTLESYQLTGEPNNLRVRGFTSWVWRPRCASNMVDRLEMRRHTGKYLMYLHGGRRVEDEITGQGRWQRVTWVQVGQRAFRAKSLVPSNL